MAAASERKPRSRVKAPPMGPDLDVIPPGGTQPETLDDALAKMFSRPQSPPVVQKSAASGPVPVNLDGEFADMFNALAEANSRADIANKELERLKAQFLPIAKPMIAATSKSMGRVTPSILLSTDRASGNFTLVQGSTLGRHEVPAGKSVDSLLNEKAKKAGLDGEAMARAKSLYTERKVTVAVDLNKLQNGTEDQQALFKKVQSAIFSHGGLELLEKVFLPVTYAEPLPAVLDKANEASKTPEELSAMMAVMEPKYQFSGLSFGQVMVNVEVTEEDRPEGRTYSGGGWTAVASEKIVTLTRDGVGVEGKQECNSPSHAINLARKVIADEARRNEFLRDHAIR